MTKVKEKTKVKAKVKKKIGRPTDYTPELADNICSQLADGLSMRTVCKPKAMPNKATVFKWLRTNEEFNDQYVKAKEESADALTDEILDIADNCNNDWMENEGDSTGYKINGEAVQRSRLRIDSRKWLASKLKPKKYGDKIQQEITAPEGVTFNMDFGVKKDSSNIS
jgi:hypothetical protein